MISFFKRNFFYANKYQKRLIFPVLLACLIISVIALLCLDYLYFDQAALIYGFNFSHFKMLVKWFTPLVIFMLVFVWFMICFISNRIIGPYSRIVRELDEIVDGKHRKSLKVRKGDEMFGEITRRINSLIDKLP